MKVYVTIYLCFKKYYLKNYWVSADFIASLIIKNLSAFLSCGLLTRTVGLHYQEMCIRDSLSAAINIYFADILTNSTIHNLKEYFENNLCSFPNTTFI